MFEGLDSRSTYPLFPSLDLPGPSKPIRVEPIEEPGRQPVETPEEPSADPDIAPERDREPVEVPG